MFLANQWHTRRIIEAKQYFFTLRLKHCVGKERAIKLLSYLLIVSIKYHSFHSAFKLSLLVHMSFFKAIIYAYHIMVFLILYRKLKTYRQTNKQTDYVALISTVSFI